MYDCMKCIKHTILVFVIDTTTDNHVFEVRSTGGLSYLGGEDFNKKIFGYIKTKIMR